MDAKCVENIVTSYLDDSGTWVKVLVNPVSKAHQAERIRLVLGLVEPFLSIATVVLDVLEHFDHFLVGTTVEGTPERRYAGSNRGV